MATRPRPAGGSDWLEDADAVLNWDQEREDTGGRQRT